jgi:hypothetical protein
MTYLTRAVGFWSTTQKRGLLLLISAKTLAFHSDRNLKYLPPDTRGKKSFLVSDGRTTRTIGNYPRVELTAITVFDVQPELSFAYISDTSDRSTEIEIGANLEAIPTGSISHLLAGASKYFPLAMDHIKVGDSSAVQEYIAINANTKINPFAVVLRFSAEQEFLKRYGSAALNAALARLFQETTRTFHSAAATGILDSSSVCTVGAGSSYNEEALTAFSEKLRNDHPELKIRTGVFCHNDIEKNPANDNSVLDSSHAIEFARYAASDYAAETNLKIIHFSFVTARKILTSLRESKAFKQGIADFEKLRVLGVESAALMNLGGLLYSGLNSHQKAADVFETASKRDPTQLVYKSNFGTAMYPLKEVERGLQVLNTLTDQEVEKVKELHPYGYHIYARLLARAKLGGLTSFNASRFSKVGPEALALPGFIGPASEIISKALSEL